MQASKLRRQIAWEAARLMYDREESEYYRAKLKAARRICRDRVKPKDLPSNSEIRDEIQIYARVIEGEGRDAKLRQMRLEALRMMHLLKNFSPRLIGSVLTGHIRAGSDIDLHIFSSSIEPVTSLIEEAGVLFDIQRKRITKGGEETIYTHIHVQDEFPFELTLYPLTKLNFAFKSSITGKAIERASIAQLEKFLQEEYPDIDINLELDNLESRIDRFQYYESLLLPLENVRQNLKWHPEGDALYHSLQVFDLACDQHPWDEEFLLAALLHDVGKAIDPHDHVRAGLEALEGFITPRTEWLIENHMLAHKIRDQTIGARAHRRLRENESYEELITLAEIDKLGRQVGVPTTSLCDAIQYVRDLMQSFDPG